MPCANCGKTYEEHASGLAYRDFTGAGTECPRYAPQCPLCFDSGQVMRTDPADQKSVFYDKCPKCALAGFTTDVPLEDTATIECPCCNIESEYDLRCFR